MIQPPETLVTERLLLRRPGLIDAADLYAYTSDPRVTRYMVWRTHTSPSETVDFLESCVQRWDSGEEFGWAIAVKPEQRAIGMIACRIEVPQADFGYVLHRDFWGRGYATEAVQAVIGWLSQLPELDRIWATCDAENLSSARVLEKCGLQRQAALAPAMLRPNLSTQPRETLLFVKEFVGERAGGSLSASPRY